MVCAEMMSFSTIFNFHRFNVGRMYPGGLDHLPISFLLRKFFYMSHLKDCIILITLANRFKACSKMYGHIHKNVFMSKQKYFIFTKSDTCIKCIQGLIFQPCPPLGRLLPLLLMELSREKDESRRKYRSKLILKFIFIRLAKHIY